MSLSCSSSITIKTRQCFLDGSKMNLKVKLGLFSLGQAEKLSPITSDHREMTGSRPEASSRESIWVTVFQAYLERVSLYLQPTQTLGPALCPRRQPSWWACIISASLPTGFHLVLVNEKQQAIEAERRGWAISPSIPSLLLVPSPLPPGSQSGQAALPLPGLQ